MLARNPKTGKPLRIVQSESSAWRDQKTLVWLDAAADATVPWDRWDIATVGVADYDALTAKGVAVDILMLLNPEDADFLRNKTSAAHALKLIVITKAIVTAIGVQALATLRLGNLLCLDEFADLYPHTGAPWVVGDHEDAKALVALALRSCVSFPVTPSSERAAIATKRGLSFSAELKAPRPLWFITQYYKPSQRKRRDEIDTCLKQNVANPLIDRIVLLNEASIPLPIESQKLLEEVVGHRLTYADVFHWIAEKAPDNALVVFANADIYLDPDSWRSVWSMNVDDKFIALLRWDLDSPGAQPRLFGPRADSQDTWLVSAASVKQHVTAAAWNWDAITFPFGQGGCDNAIAMEMFKQRFLVVNPALTLRTFHLHASAVRNYDPANIVDKPAYLYIHPTGLNDLKPVISLPAPHATIAPRPFMRPIQGPLTPAQAKTFAAMLSRSTQEAVKLDVAGANTAAPAKVPIYKFQECFQSRTGLVFTPTEILMGATKASKEMWQDAELSTMAAALPVKHALVAPLPDATARAAGPYVLDYLSKIFLLQDQLPAGEKGEFWCAKDKGCIEALKMFQWPDREIPVLSRDETAQVWCSEALVWYPQDVHTDCSVTTEQVGALRTRLGLGGWLERAEEQRRVVIAVDDSWITDSTAGKLEDAFAAEGISVDMVWPGRTGLDRIVQLLRGAHGLVLLSSSSVAAWSWVLPRGAMVWEVQSEMAPSAKSLHVSGAAGLQHQLLIVPKGVPTDLERAAVVKGICGTVVREISTQVATKPVVVLPTGAEGTIFAHAGDSFREMVEIWGERGFVEVRRDSGVRQVWLGGVGDVLLYDRPTLEWLSAAPGGEISWKRALFGNPAPLAGESAWTFWPRRPRLVEKLALLGIPEESGWADRRAGLVFYGKAENSVQQKRRGGADWESACEVWSMPKGDTPYPFTQEEYLMNLSKSRFGLCLAGFGFKCHREVECMAMGCVPVCGPEVDMVNYADPPREGVHYLRAATPEEAKKLVEGTPKERWEAMSAAGRDWWRRNASVEGSWALTKRLSGF